LPESAAIFLVGVSLAGVEDAADRLVTLLAASGRQLEPEPATAPIADLRITKVARQAAILRRFHTPSQQPRDEAGRFAAKPGRSSFDGGARRPLPLGESPEQAHNPLVGELAGLRRTFDL
jgi:hypothetical protein